MHAIVASILPVVVEIFKRILRSSLSPACPSESSRISNNTVSTFDALIERNAVLLRHGRGTARIFHSIATNWRLGAFCIGQIEHLTVKEILSPIEVSILDTLFDDLIESRRAKFRGGRQGLGVRAPELVTFHRNTGKSKACSVGDCVTDISELRSSQLSEVLSRGRAGATFLRTVRRDCMVR